MKYTVPEFAGEIRKMYPGDYNDLSDHKLVELWLKKYPKDIDKVELGNPSPIENKDLGVSSKKSSSVIKAIWTGIFLGIILLGIIFLVYYSNQGSTNNLTSSNAIRSVSSKNSLKNNISSVFSTDPYNSIEIKSEISKQVDASGILNGLHISNETKLKIKKILSDPNPDPENKNGSACGNIQKNCKYCSRTFNVVATNRTAQDFFNWFLFNPLFESGLSLAMAFGLTQETDFTTLIVHVCDEFGKGKKYLCDDWNETEFCSLKCQDEYKLYHR